MKAVLWIACWITRRFKVFPGRWRVVRALKRRREALSSLRPIDVRFKQGRVRVESATNAGIYIEGLSVDDPHERLMRHLLISGDNVADVGANIGYFSVFFAASVGPVGKVFAFEPNTEIVKELRANVKLNGLINVVLLEKALSDRNGQAEFHIPRGRSALSSVRRLDDWVTEHLVVDALRFDSMLEDLPRLRLVKIDVEGAEGRVIRGMGKLIERDHPLIQFELTDDWLRQCGDSAETLIGELTNYGYSVYEIRKDALKALSLPTAWQVEALAVHEADEWHTEIESLKF